MKSFLTILFVFILVILTVALSRAEVDGHGYRYGNLSAVFIPYYSNTSEPCSYDMMWYGANDTIFNVGRNTYNITRIVPTIAPPMLLKAAPTCANRYIIVDEARALYPDYDLHILVGKTLEGCTSNGFGGIGRGYAFSFGCPNNVGPLCHEFHHALGLYHESQDNEDDGSYSSGYTGDPYDAMGCQLMNAPNRVRLHAIAPRWVEPGTSTTLKNYRKFADALKIARDYENDYTVGFDGTHVTVHYGINVWSGFNPFVIDLSVGDSWQSAVRGFLVRFVGIDSNGDASIEITDIPPLSSSDYHPADVNNNSLIEAGEALNYRKCYLSKCNWKGIGVIKWAYADNAKKIYLNGMNGRYTINSTGVKPDGYWIVG